MIKKYLEMLRVTQWIKNLFVFVPVVFAKQLFYPEYIYPVLLAFLAFCLTSSSVYILNDLMDIESDRQHPVKKERPIPSGIITKANAISIMIILFVSSFGIASILNINFLLALAGYTLLNIFYTLVLKHIVIIDIISIASGFMIRVLAGAFVISVYLSSWLILTTLFISLFLATMKRRSELNLAVSESENSTRKVLSEYSINFTEQIGSISAAGVIICYALYSVSERTIKYLNSENLVFTTIFVVFGIFRFMYLVYKKSKGENATEVMLTDIPMIVNIVFYIIVTVYIVYLG